MQSEQINELAAALSKAQGVLRNAEKDGTNPHFRSKYATIESIWDAIRDPLTRNGLAVIQAMQGSGESLSLITTLVHSSGQWVRSEIPLISGKPTPQALGSAVTYMRRYALAAIVGATSGEDDDANQAEEYVKKQPDLSPISWAEAEEIEQALLEFDDCIEYRNRMLESCSKQYKVAMRDFTNLPKEALKPLRESILRKKAKAEAK